MVLFERLRERLGHKKNGVEKRSIWRPNTWLPPERIQEQRKELGLSGTETYQLLETLSGKNLLEAQPVQNLLAYTANWDPFIANRESKVTQKSPITINPKTSEIYLPNAFVRVNRPDSEDVQWGNIQFYWDTYFINKALLASGRKEYVDLAKGHIDNFQYLFDNYGYIPNGSSTKMDNRSQTPFLTGMIMDIYHTTGDKKWLGEKIEFAKKEYFDVWMYTEKEARQKGINRPAHRISEDSLFIRPTGTDVLSDPYGAAANMGYDDSAEWARRAYETSPLLLNGAMYKYEKEFAVAARELGNIDEANFWEERSEKRKKEINEKHWDEERGMYFNLQLNRETGKWEKDTAYSGLSTFMPLWLNIASPEQADKVVRNLGKFESQYGLFIAAADTGVDMTRIRRINRTAYKDYARYIPALDDVFKPEQWNYPNMWANIEYIAIEGMLNYGKIPEAKRTIEHILRSSASFFQEKGTLPEKMNGITGFNGGSYQYGDMEGFGMHNSLCQIGAGRLQDIENNRYDRIAS